MKPRLLEKIGKIGIRRLLTGLGLAVSYAIIDKYGGKMRFETRTAREGGEGPTGTTFFVSLAAGNRHQRPARRSAGPPTEEVHKRMGRILAVDDELDMLALLKMIIEGYSDHQVTTTNNPLEAAELLEKDSFDLILTDLKMPGMDGMELLARAKQRDEDALVLVITAYGSLESAEEAMAKGAFDFITKPFRKEQILLAIDKAMRWREMVRQNKELKQRLEEK